MIYIRSYPGQNFDLWTVLYFSNEIKTFGQHLKIPREKSED